MKTKIITTHQLKRLFYEIFHISYLYFKIISPAIQEVFSGYFWSNQPVFGVKHASLCPNPKHVLTPTTHDSNWTLRRHYSWASYANRFFKNDHLCMFVREWIIFRFSKYYIRNSTPKKSFKYRFAQSIARHNLNWQLMT